MMFFTPWLTGAIVVHSVWIGLYLLFGRHSDPVGWGFALVANVVMMMLASVGTEIVRAIEANGRRR